MDVLTDFLTAAGASVEVDRRIACDADWQTELAGGETIDFFAISAGAFELRSDVASLELGEGQLAFAAAPGRTTIANLGGDGASLIAGRIHLQPSMANIADWGQAPWLAIELDSTNTALVARLIAEATDASPGWRSTARAIAHGLFVSALRTHGAAPGEDPGLMRGLADPEIGEALRLMHLHPNHPWTVAELAERLAVSRSGFAARFKKIAGRPPLAYLTWWRLHRAAAQLRGNDGATLVQVARAAGYDSDASFGKAFRREFGMTPGQMRRDGGRLKSSPLQLELKKRTPFEVPEQEAVLNLMKSSEKIRCEVELLFAAHGLTIPAYNLLRILRGAGEALPLAEIEARMVIAHPSPPDLVAELCAAGFVEQKADGALAVTTAGKEVLANLDDAVLDLHRRQLAHFSAMEIADLNRLLAKLRRTDL
ncbi:helix-turn-helix domain-containing protein [Lacipirellula parvula]|uniref:Transcriptional regulator n=1 Tax=Lacipirellula parvula TaxID=2650471 RepID=A0A5K7XAI8_9BACT|nr:helix-turn-helix domain-containing protein [Lacipirellula parvula]BBO31761.1 transcriptional regulator [Lacipirellula parvula]